MWCIQCVKCVQFWQEKLQYSVSMISCDESQSEAESSEPDLSAFYMIGGKKCINRGRWTKQEVYN